LSAVFSETKMRASQRLRFLFPLLLAALLVTGAAWAATNPLAVSVIDVGQGDSILVQFPGGQDMLVDAGDRDAGPTVVHWLRSRGVKSIDILVASHPHADHIGGMQAVLSAFPIGKVWDSGYNQGSRTQQEFLGAIKAKGIRFGMPKAGFSQNVGDVTVAVLAPKTQLAGTDSDANNNSLVLRIVYGNISFLLPGDMEGDERATIGTWPRSSVLKVAHHGSRNGTDLAFAKAVSPRYAVISYGQGNPYGHPHAEAVTALQAVGAKVLQTAVDGTVVFTTDGKSVSCTTMHTARITHGRRASGAVIYSPVAAAAVPKGTVYIGNARSHIFHRLSCSTLPPAKNAVYFRSRAEAVSQGYRPCRRCNP
jgi:competence protein ComEC